jgi:LacI family transcriptional regulator
VRSPSCSTAGFRWWLFDREVADARADAVIAENVGAARSALELLVGGGHRRTAFVSGRTDVETGAERLDGYQLAMRVHGLELRSSKGASALTPRAPRWHS